MRKFILLSLLAGLAALLQGCLTYMQEPAREPEKTAYDARVDYNDPVLNRRQILLFGKIDQRAAELTIQKLLYLEGKSHEPIDLYLQTPGGEIKSAQAVQRTMGVLKSPVNTYALSECMSGGAMLLTAGTGKRRAFQGSVIVVHGMTFGGNPPAEFKQQHQDSYTQFWRKRARLPDAWLPLPYGIQHVLSAEQALKYGIVDEIVEK